MGGFAGVGNLANFNETLQRHIAQVAAEADRRREQEQQRRIALAAEEARDGDVVNNFLVGCDPEFVVTDAHGQLINCAQYIGTGETEIGTDHNGRVAELRPAPAMRTLTIVKRLQKLIQDEKLKNIPGAHKFRAGALFNRQPLGGHVHLDINPYVQGRETETVVGLNNPGLDGLRHLVVRPPAFTPDHPQRLMALDHVTQRLEQLDILPTQESQARRADGYYGGYSEIRIQGPPDKRRFEYRTMASWLYDPTVAYICLTGAKLAAMNPSATFELLMRRTHYPYRRLQEWFAAFEKDADAARVSRILEKGHKHIVADPEVDFRTKWEAIPA